MRSAGSAEAIIAGLLLLLIPISTAGYLVRRAPAAGQPQQEGDTTMVEGQSMTVGDVVARVRDGRLEDFVKEGGRVGRL